MCCKKLLLTSTKGKIHHSLTGIYARMEQNFVKYSPMPVPLYFKTDFRNELNGFQATIYFDHKSKPKCPEGCWVIGMECNSIFSSCLELQLRKALYILFFYVNKHFGGQFWISPPKQCLITFLDLRYICRIRLNQTFWNVLKYCAVPPQQFKKSP